MQLYFYVSIYRSIYISIYLPLLQVLSIFGLQERLSTIQLYFISIYLFIYLSMSTWILESLCHHLFLPAPPDHVIKILKQGNYFSLSLCSRLLLLSGEKIKEEVS